MKLREYLLSLDKERVIDLFFMKDWELRMYEENETLMLKALSLACEELDDAKDMLREAGKNDWAGVLNVSADYFIQKAEAKLKELNND